MLKKSFFILLTGLIISCTHTEEDGSIQSFRAPRDTVWEVLVTIFKAYPLKTIDESKGYIETEVLQAEHFWIPPHQNSLDFSGYSAVLKVSLSYQKPFTKVYIDKKVYKQKGFISSKTTQTSDFLEESTLFYQISKELSMKKKLRQMKQSKFK